MANIPGTSGPDTLLGTIAADLITGLGGDDTLKGGGGDDVLEGGLGNDLLKGGGGDDTLNGGDDNDTLIGSKGADTLDGGEGDDIYRVTVKDAGTLDTFADSGAAGTDTLDATRVTSMQLSDVFDDSNGIEVITGDIDLGTILFGGASPVLWDFALLTLTDILRIEGSIGDDQITGSAGDDTIKGLGGDDVLNGAGGNDTLAGGGGADELNGNAGDDTVKGGGGDDILDGGFGDDALKGGKGDDVLVYDADDVTKVDGGVGEDTLSVSGSGVDLDLTATSGTVHLGLEVIDINGAGANSLTLNKIAVLALSSDSNTVRVLGGSNDAVVVSSDNWVQGGTTDVDSITFDVYTNGAATLQVQQGVVTFIDTVDNDAPVAAGDTVSAGEDGTATTGNVLGNDFDADGDTLTVSGADTTSAGGGLVTNNNDGTFGYDPNGQFESLAAGQTDTDTFTYTVSDGNGGTDTATVTVTITGVNDAPIITSNGGDTPTGINVAENSTAVTDVNATDVDAGATLTYSISGGADASLFGINSGTGVLSFLAAPNFESPADTGTNNVYNVTVQASDGTLTDTQALSITVTNVNDVAPVVVVNADPVLNYTVGAPGVVLDGTTLASVTDADSTTLSSATISIQNVQAGDVLAFDDQGGILGISGSYNSGTGVLTLTGSAPLSGYVEALASVTFSTSSLVQVDRTISFTVNDGVNTSAADTVTVDIDPGVSLSALDGSNGFRVDAVLGEVIIGSASGYSVSGAGDVNGDGFADLLIGGPFAHPGGDGLGGESYVVFGGSGFDSSFDLGDLNGANGFRLDGIDACDFSGRSVSAAGDVNGDGFADLLIGADGADAGGDADAGESYVVFGGSSFTSSLDLGALNGTNGFRLDGIDTDDYSGRSVSAAGDVNGDGFGDLLIGAWGADAGGDSYAGESYVVFGGSAFASSLDLGALNGTNGFRLDGIDLYDKGGRSVSAAGDVNGDGFADLLIGAYGADGNAGESYVVFGGSAFASSLNLGALNGSDGFRLDGIDASDHSGISVSDAGDVNGDGFADLLIGARQADAGGDNYAGESYVVFGGSAFTSSLNLGALNGTNGFRLDGIDTGDNSGSSVSGVGDVNGDGFADLLIGAYLADGNAGESYLVFGGSSFTSSLDLGALNGTNGFRLDGIDGGYVGDRSGFSVSAAGDVNGDGFADFLIGAPTAFIGESYVIFGGDFRDEADFVGGAGNDTFTGGSGADILIGGLGNDTLNGGAGADVLHGGAGNDVLTFDTSDSHVDGGNGTDTAALSGSGVNLDLTDVPNNVLHNIEGIDLTGSGNNTLTLDTLSLLNLSDTSNTLRVEGNTGDAVVADGLWKPLSDTIIDSVTYHQLQRGEAILQVQDGVDTSGIAIQMSMLHLSALNGSNGFELDGDSGVYSSGWSVSNAGDINGDGLDDLLIGAADFAHSSLAGTAYVVFGSSTGLSSSFSLSALTGSNGFQINGEVAFDRAGISVSAAGDVNGDGFDDVMVGADGADILGSNSGSTYVLFGSGSAFSSAFDLGDINGSNGFRLVGEAAEDLSGRSVSSAGDLNGDGYDDVLVGAPYRDIPGNFGGSTYVMFGKASGFSGDLDLVDLDGNNGFEIDGEFGGDFSGGSVSNAGDVNGDGFDDLLIGAYGRNTPGFQYDAGAAYVVFGKEAGYTSNLSLSEIDGNNGFEINGLLFKDYAGNSVSSAGDVNGDGFDDVIIGAWKADTNGYESGTSYVVFGKAAGFTANLSVSDLDGSNGFAINGEAASDFSGVSVSSAGDVNGDGFDDMLIGAYKHNSDGVDAGSTYLVFGSATGFSATLDLSDLDGLNGFEIAGESNAPGGFNGDYSGKSVSAAGDVNGDGFDDLLIGANGRDVVSGAGASYVVFGRDFRDEANFIGGSGNDTHTGGTGDEVLIGGLGNDTISGAGGADVLTGGRGTDMLNGDGGADKLRGGTGADTLDGGNGEDRLEGGNGADTLDGGLGNDVLIGGAGNDSFVFNDTLGATNVDTLMDFGGAGAAALDLIKLDNGVFTALSDGALTGAEFESGAGLTAAATGDGRIVYDTTSGALYYDEDGVGGNAAVQFAVIATDVDGLSAADFVVI